jgi:hypothetical protein
LAKTAKKKIDNRDKKSSNMKDKSLNKPKSVNKAGIKKERVDLNFLLKLKILIMLNILYVKMHH